MQKALYTSFASFILIISLLLLSLPSEAISGAIPETGASLPSFQLSSPTNESDLSYLGLKSPDFYLKDIDCQVLLVEIIGIYCSRCYQQAPLFNRLFSRLNKKGMGDKVKMLAVAAGATDNEVEHVRSDGTYAFPVVKDEPYAVHKLLGEPRTPFTMLVAKDGRVLFAHLGVVEDVDALFEQIRNLVK